MMMNKKKLGSVIFTVVFDVLVVVLSMFLALYITENRFWVDIHVALWLTTLLLSTIFAFIALRLYSMMYFSAGMVEFTEVLTAVFAVFIFNTIFCLLDGPITFRNAVVFSLLQLFFTSLLRFSKRVFLTVKSATKSSVGAVPVLVVGGGMAGSALVKEMQTTDKLKYLPVCIVDDDLSKVGSLISGVKIAGTTEKIPELVKKHHIKEILIAVPSAPKAEIKRILYICKQTSCKVKTLPGTYQILTGEARIANLKDVEITDLLGRDQVKVNLDEIMGYIEGQVVMVTGGGGSIGSELCRQIAGHNPKQLIIFDIYENNAYDIEQELKRKHPELNLLTLIASVRDKGKVEDTFKKYKPDIVFNAAAHKHVPLMETSPNEAVKNNVFGTLNVARMADKYKVKVFVQISTDKAVNPTNVMGATKRICEMIIQTIGRSSKNTKFVAVRFGNVLGSNGSVIPLFKQQINEGGPVTVTHKDIIRYFMTIPEAVSLVLQAGAYAKNGQIFVLDMGEPVKIYDLAYNLIKLMGYEPNVDMEIKCTGLRPGEKLFEERLMDEEGLQTTDNGLINIANPIDIDEAYLWSMLDKLYAAAYEEVDDMKALVSQLVPTYKVDKN